MKRFEVIDLSKNLSSFDIRSGNKFFMFALEKNKATIKTLISEINEKRNSLVPSEYVEFENARMALLAEHSKKDESGNPIVDGNSVVLEDTEKFNVVFSELKEKYSEAIKNLGEADKAFGEFLKEDVSVEFAKISFKFVPEVITSEQYAAIRAFIKETDEEILALGE